jgi:hypothetical protein
MACIYQRGQIWWGNWYAKGGLIRQGIGTQDKAEASNRLKALEAETFRSAFKPTTGRAITWDTAAQDLLTYYHAYGTRNPSEASIRLRQLSAYF